MDKYIDIHFKNEILKFKEDHSYIDKIHELYIWGKGSGFFLYSYVDSDTDSDTDEKAGKQIS